MSSVTSCRNALVAAGLLAALVACDREGQQTRVPGPADSTPTTVESTDTAPTVTPEIIAEAEAALLREEQQLVAVPLPDNARATVCGMGSGITAGPRFIGPGGGTLEHPGGHVLRVPAGALADYTSFTMKELPTPEIKVLARDRLGERFLQPTVTLTVSYSRCTGGERADSLWRHGTDGSTTNVTGSNSGTAITSRGLPRLSNFALATN